jgi:hypothetical protein
MLSIFISGPDLAKKKKKKKVWYVIKIIVCVNVNSKLSSRLQMTLGCRRNFDENSLYIFPSNSVFVCVIQRAAIPTNKKMPVKLKSQTRLLA